MYFRASEETEDTEVTAQLLNRLLCCFARGWCVTFNLQLRSLSWCFNCMSRWGHRHECFIQLHTLTFIIHIFQEQAKAKAFGLWMVLKCLISDLSLWSESSATATTLLFHERIHTVELLVIYYFVIFIYIFLCHNLNMVQCLLIEFYWQQNNRGNEIRSNRRISFTSALITGFFYSGYHSITGHYTLLLQWKAIIDSIRFSVYPSGRHVFVLCAGLINRKPKRGVHSGLPLMYGSKVHENRRHHFIMRSVTVGCSQRSLVFVLSEGHAPCWIKGIPLQTDKGITFDLGGKQLSSVSF